MWDQGGVAPRIRPSMTPTFSIVVPVYNEASFIPTAMPLLLAELDGLGIEYELLLVENGSTDDTADAARSFSSESVKVVSLGVANYGMAMHEGFKQSRGDWVVNFDIDYFSAEFLSKVATIEGADIVIASKRDPESQDRRPFIRRLATGVFNLMLRGILNSRVSDTHGMKAFRKQVIAELNDKVVSRQDLFDTELVIRAERANYTIKEVPVIVEEMRTARSSLVKRVPRTVIGLFRIRRLLADQSDGG
jgi:glycosyltransferase involved in cell wall biosynthesis